jgi:hypothetical protein
MAQSSPQPPKQRRRPSPTRLLKSAVAAGLSIRGIELDPTTGKYTVLVGEPAPVKAGGEDDTVIETAAELRKLL